MCYNNASLLSFGEFLLQSEEGAQQGNPLGPLLFCVSIMDLVRNMTSELNIWYMDDGTIGGQLDDLLHDLDTVRRIRPTLGLQLKEDKCEIVTDDEDVTSRFRAVMPSIRHSSCSDATLLGAPIGDISSIDTVLTNKLTDFQRLASRLTTLGAHDALFLLKNCFGMPKLLYTLRSAPCYQSSILTQYDTVIRQTLQLILNLDLTESVWNQATLPVSRGGLGVRLATDLTLPAFLSFVAGASTLTFCLLSSRPSVSYQIAYKIFLGYKTFSTPRHVSNGKHGAIVNFQTQIRSEVMEHTASLAESQPAVKCVTTPSTT